MRQIDPHAPYPPKMKRALIFTLAIFSICSSLLIWLGAEIGSRHLLDRHIRLAGETWVHEIMESVPNLDKITNGGRLSMEEATRMHVPSDAGRIVQYRILDAQGKVAISPDPGEIGKIRLTKEELQAWHGDPSKRWFFYNTKKEKPTVEVIAPIWRSDKFKGLTEVEIDISNTQRFLFKLRMGAILIVLAFFLAVSGILYFLFRWHQSTQRWF